MASEDARKGSRRQPGGRSVQRPATRLPGGYADLLEDLKMRIRAAQMKAALSANQQLIILYWEIGTAILARQRQEGWGAKVVERLSTDLRTEFPNLRGFSPRNLLFMRSFADAYPDGESVKQLVSQIPWGHLIRLLQAVKDPVAREWYIRQTIEHGWSRNVLALQVKSRLHERQGRAITNFPTTLPAPESDLARETLKDPYVFDFLAVGDEIREREVQRQLVQHITRFLLELGAGFAFLAEQYRLEVSERDYFIDLLFYHTRLHCYVAIELKAGEFRPEHAGKINFYLSALDDQLRASDDKPSIGLILCATKDQLTAEYALRDMAKPIGVAEWQTHLTRRLPAHLRASLPTIEQLEAELAGHIAPQGPDQP